MAGMSFLFLMRAYSYEESLNWMSDQKGHRFQDQESSWEVPGRILFPS